MKLCICGVVELWVYGVVELLSCGCVYVWGR